MGDFSNLKREYTGFGDKSYITFSVPVSEEVKQYQIEMLAKNKIPLLLPMSVQRINDDLKLSYEITSKIPLDKILKRKMIKPHEFEHIITQIGNLAGKLKDYLLDINSLILNKSLIYCNPSDLSLYFMYFPLRMQENNHYSIRDFLLKLVVEDIHLLDDSSGSLLKRLLDVLKSEMFTPEKLLQCINISVSKEPFEVSQKKPANRSVNLNVSWDDYVNNTPQANKQREISIPKQKINDKNMKKTVHYPFRISLNYPLQSYLITGAVNIVFIIVIIYILRTIESGNLLSTVFGLILIAFAANYFIITRFFSDNKKDKSVSKSGASNKKTTQKRFVNEAIEEDIILLGRPSLINRTPFYPYEVSTTGNLNNTEHVIWKAQEENSFFDKPEDNTKKHTTITNVKNTDSQNSLKYSHDKTMVLGETVENEPYLQNHLCRSEKIIITKESMLLGRLTDSVDYVIQNKAVGKIHAEILKKEDGYYIIDLNSVNGTYVNNERIICNTEVKLKNGDTITFANESYTLIF